MYKPAMAEELCVCVWGGLFGVLGVVIKEVLKLGCTMESPGEHL